MAARGISGSRIFRNAVQTGIVLGLALALLMLLLVKTGWYQDLGVERIVAWVVSSPALSFQAIRESHEAIQWIILFAWWAAVGGCLGWFLSRRGAGSGTLLVAAVFIIAVIAGHSAMMDSIYQTPGHLFRAFERALHDLFGPR